MSAAGRPGGWWYGLLGAVLLMLAACGKAPPVHQEAYVFGTRVEVQVQGLPEAQARVAIGEVLREFDRLHRMLHPWEASELTRLNAALAQGQSLEVSPELAALLKDAATVAARGQQLFNPAIGRLVALWGFHADAPPSRVPAREAVDALLRAAPSMADLDIAGNVVASRNRAVQLDLGGYAKGYALDRAAEILRRHGAANALINIGGNVLALGTKAGTPWRVGIQHPRKPVPMAIVELRDGEAVGTSGDYQRYFEADGRRYSHLIDPRSGFPAQGAQSVTLLIPAARGAGTLSDAGSKPLVIAGATDWPRLAAAMGITHVLRVNADGSLQATAAMASRLRFEGEKPALRLVEPSAAR